MNLFRFFIFLSFLPAILFSLTSDEALGRLLEGNQRFIEAKSRSCFFDQNDRRKALIDNQKPFAVILGCSDSRVPPEILFDQGIGDLFIIRVAGNVLGPSEIDSISYAIKILEAPLIIVLGHENCGAVNAVWKKKAQAIPYLNKQILASIDFSDPHATLEDQIKLNIQHIVGALKHTPQFIKQQEDGKLKILGAYYPLVSGKVEILKKEE